MSHGAEQSSWVPWPSYSLPGCPFPIKSLALSPRTIHFQMLDKSPLSGPGRGPPFHSKWIHRLTSSTLPNSFLQGSALGNCFCCLVAKLCQLFCDAMVYNPQVPLSMGFPRQEYWSGLPFTSPGHLLDPGIKWTHISCNETPWKDILNRIEKMLSTKAKTEILYIKIKKIFYSPKNY